MAKNRNEQPLVPSVLDRLLDFEPDSTREAVPSPNQLLRDLKHSVRRDLENLLNTRVRLLTWPPHLQELKQSLLNYGLPDFTSVNLSSSKEREDFCRVIQDIIVQLEPRLLKVSVSPLSPSEPLDRTFHFRIDALLRIDPAPEPVVFDSNVEATTGGVEIREVAG
ncbi:MAG TPA: type VI secretion system baseplate subunit TssE [Gemmataceae bacterium]|jgi:type VI secretion system protein ImpF